MRDTRKSEIKVGATVITAIVVVLLVIGWTKNLYFGDDRQFINIKFDSVAGLEKGDHVTVNGVKKGNVESITLNGNDVVVKVVVEKDTELKEDAVFSVMMLDLMGGKKIEITPGKSVNKMDYSKMQTGSFSGDISTAMAMLSSVQGDLVAVIKDVRVSLENLNKLLTDEELKNDVKSSMKNLNNLTSNLSTVLNENKNNLKKLLSEGALLAENGNKFFNENSQTIKDFLLKSKETVTNANDLVLKVESFMDETKNKQNNFGELLYDKDIITDLKTTIKDVKELLKVFVEQLKGKGLKVDAYIF